jgi:hypothetical protein
MEDGVGGLTLFKSIIRQNNMTTIQLSTAMDARYAYKFPECMESVSCFLVDNHLRLGNVLPISPGYLGG